GSGSLVDLRPWGFPYEPTVPEVVASGVDLVSFSGDKLLGGPQAGIVVGKRAIVSRLKKNPWNRALRIDKFTIAALEGTLTAYEDGTARETVPTLRLLTEPLATVVARARRVLRGLGAEAAQRLAARAGASGAYERGAPPRRGGHRRPHRPRQDLARQGADGDRHRPPAGGEGARHHHRPRLRVPRGAGRPHHRGRRRAGSRAVREEHAGGRRRHRPRHAR